MKLYNYRDHGDDVLGKIPLIVEEFFDSDTLVIYDVRSSIVSSVLPNIPHVATYDQRIISLLSSATLVCSEPFDGKILDYYRSMGLCNGCDIITVPHQSYQSLVDQIISNEALCEELKSKHFKRMVFFFPTQSAVELSNRLSIPMSNTLTLSLRANNKVELKKFLVKSGMPTIEGVITNDSNIIQNFLNHREPYFIKLSHGVSGFGLFDTGDNVVIDDILRVSGGNEVIIERKINVLASPSVQIYCSKEESFIIGITDQILEEGRYYLGNTYPSSFSDHELTNEILKQSESMVKYLCELGYCGFAGIDFMISDHGIYIAEINARFTGATPATVVSLLLHKNLTKERKFVSYEKWEKGFDFGLDCEKYFPICIGGSDTWGQVQLIEW